MPNAVAGWICLSTSGGAPFNTSASSRSVSTTRPLPELADATMSDSAAAASAAGIALMTAAAAAGQGLTLVHIRAQLEQLQDTFLS